MLRALNYWHQKVHYTRTFVSASECRHILYKTPAEMNTNQNSLTEQNQTGDNARSVDTEQVLIDDSRLRIASMKSSDDDFKQFTTHPVKIDHVNVTSASVSTLLTNDLVALYLATIAASPMGKKLANFSYFRATLVLRFVVQGQPFAAGKIVMAATPMPKYGQGNGWNNLTTKVIKSLGKVNSMIVPHVALDPAKNGTYELRLPIVSPTGAYAIKNNSVGSYRLERIIINALKSGTATTPTINVCTYMYLENTDFEAITLTSNDFAAEKKKTGTLSTFANAVADTAKKVGEVVPVFGPAINLFSEVSSTVGNVLAFLGFSKPPAVENETFIINRFGDNYSQFDGLSTAIVLAGSAKTSMGLHAGYACGDSDDVLIDKIIAIEGLVNQFTITQASAAEAFLQVLQVLPTVYMTDIGGRALSPLAGTALPFSYWVGDIDITIEAVASVFHRATLLIAWEPNQPAATPSFSDALETLQNVTIPISGYTKTKITIPWKQNVAFQQTGLTLVTNTANNASCTNGEIYFFLVNPVTANGSTDGIDVNVYYSSRNMKFFGPNPVKLNEGGEAHFRWLDETLTMNDPPSTEVSFGKKTDLKLAAFRSFGEEYHSLKQLISKMNTVFQGSFVMNASVWEAVGLQWPNFPMSPCKSTTFSGAPAASPTFFHSFFEWYGTAFLGVRGGMRFSFHAGLNETGEEVAMKHHYHALHSTGVALLAMEPYVGGSVQTSSAAVSTAAIDYAWNVGNRDLGPLLDVVAPGQYPYDFVNTRQRFTNWWDYVMMNIATGQPVGTTTQVICTLVAGAADDANLSMFLGYPVIDT
jgi:hypothetical protein